MTDLTSYHKLISPTIEIRALNYYAFYEYFDQIQKRLLVINGETSMTRMFFSQDPFKTGQCELS